MGKDIVRMCQGLPTILERQSPGHCCSPRASHSPFPPFRMGLACQVARIKYRFDSESRARPLNLKRDRQENKNDSRHPGDPLPGFHLLHARLLG